MNQKMLELLGEHAAKYPKYLEQHFPHVFNKLLELWGTAEMGPYFDELIMSKRPNRRGFPVEAAREIWDLHKAYLALEGASARGDIWDVDVDDLTVDAARDAWKQAKAVKKEGDT